MLFNTHTQGKGNMKRNKINLNEGSKILSWRGYHYVFLGEKQNDWGGMSQEHRERERELLNGKVL